MNVNDKNSQRLMLESFDQSQNLRVISPMQSPQYNQSQYRTSQIAIQIAKSKLMQTQLKNKQAQEQPVPTDPILYQKRMHPTKYLSILFSLLLLCSVGYGIFLPAFHCAISLVTISAFSFVGLIFESATFCRFKISYQRVSLFYVFKGVYILIVATVHLIFLFAINDATYCDYMWCQEDVTMKDFLKSFTNSVGQSTLSQQCSQFQNQYLGETQYNQLQNFLLTNIAKYCVYIGKCKTIGDISDKINGYSVASNRGYLIAFGIAFIIYSIYLFYFVSHIRNVKSQIEDNNNNTMDKPNFMNLYDESQYQNQSAFQSPHQDISQIYPYNSQQQQNLQQNEINHQHGQQQIEQNQQQSGGKKEQDQQMQVQDLQQEQQVNNYIFDDDANKAKEKEENKLKLKAQQISIVSKLKKTQQTKKESVKAGQEEAQLQNNQQLNDTKQNNNLKSSQISISSNRQQNHILQKISSSQNQQQLQNKVQN